MTMTREEELIEKIQQMCDEDREAEVIEMIDALPEEERTYKIVGLQARTLSNLAANIRNGYYDSNQEPDALDSRALDILTATAEEGKDDPNWWCRNGYTRMNLRMEAEAIPYFEHVMTLIDDDPETQEFWSDVPEAIEKCRQTVSFLEHPSRQTPPYGKTRSWMIAIPRDENHVPDTDLAAACIAGIEGVENLTYELTDDKATGTMLKIYGSFKGGSFECEIDKVTAFNPNGLKYGTYFNKADTDMLTKRLSGYGIDLKPGRGTPMEWLRLQLLIADIVVPDMLALHDLSSHQALSGLWVKSVAGSAVPPPPDIAFNIETECNNDGGDIWMYTTGMERFGLPDIEIMHGTQNHERCHNILIKTVARSLLCNTDTGTESDTHWQPKINSPIAIMAGGMPLYVRLLPWEEAIKDGDRNTDAPGSIRTRLERMNSQSCVLFAYPDEQAAAEDLYQPLWMMDDYLTNDMADNMQSLIDGKEMERRSRVTAERMDLMERVAHNAPQHEVMLRLWLEDEDGEPTDKWAKITKYTDRHNFEAEIEDNGDKIGIRFVNEPDGRIISWAIPIENFIITADSAYILDAEPWLKEQLGLQD